MLVICPPKGTAVTEKSESVRVIGSFEVIDMLISPQRLGEMHPFDGRRIILYGCSHIRRQETLKQFHIILSAIEDTLDNSLLFTGIDLI